MKALTEKYKKYAIGLLGVVMGLMVVAVATTIWKNVEDMKQTAIENNIISAEKTTELAANFIRLQDYANLLNLLESMTQTPAIEFMAIYNNEAIAISAGNKTADIIADMPQMNGINKTNSYLIKSEFLVTDSIAAVGKVRVGDQKVLRIVYSLADIEKRKVAILIATGIILMMLVVLVIVLFMLNKTQDKLIKAEDMKTHMIKTITHNANNNLNVIGARIEALKGKVAAKNNLNSLPEDLIVMNENNKAIGYMIKNLNDHDSLTKGEVKISYLPVDIVKHIQLIANSLKESMQKNKITFNMDLPDTMMITTDIKIIEQVVMNLIINAIRYSDEGKQLTVTMKEDERYITVLVEDQGRGIAKSDWERVFQPFVRLVKEGPKGSGLGLSNSRDLIRQLNGELGIRSSSLGKGSIFYIELPKYSKVAGG